MASHRSTDAAPADDQAFAEAFDEDKTATDAEIGRPDRDKEDSRVQPVDRGLTGARGERFGETVRAEGDAPGHAPDDETGDARRRQSGAWEAGEDDVIEPNGPASERSRYPAGTDVKHTSGQTEPQKKDGAIDDDARLDEAMKESFPASDPPPVRPGE
jgi:hypothetical protein